MENSERPFRRAEPGHLRHHHPAAVRQPFWTVAGYLQDKINFDLDSHTFAVIPGVRVIHQSTKPKNLGDLTNGSTVLTEEQVEKLYGKTNSDTEVLPSLTFQYDINPALTTAAI